MQTNTIVGKVSTVCVSRPLEVFANGRQVITGIFKKPVNSMVSVTKLNIDGDEQADLTVHGGIDKAIYSYPIEHYSWWQEKMPGVDFPHGKFGENLTTEGLLEKDVCVGDEFEIGTVIIKVSQPRLPCYKLGIRFNRADVIKEFMRSERSGIYFSVAREGSFTAGDAIKYLGGDGLGIGVQDVANLFSGIHKADPEFVLRALDSNLAEQMKMFIAGSIQN